jgi:MFS family permease
VKQSDDSDRGGGAPRYEGPAGGGQSQPDDDDPLASGSPRNLVPIAMTVILLFFAGIVFYIAANLEDSDIPGHSWLVAQAVLAHVATGIFYAGVLVGIGTFATARSRDAASAVPRVARMLSYGGAVVVVLGVAQSVCIVGVNEWDGWRDQAYQIAYNLGHAVFEGGVLAGLALLCLRRLRRPD